MADRMAALHLLPYGGAKGRRMLLFRLSIIGGSLLGTSLAAHSAAPEKVDLVLVDKSERRLELSAGGKAVRTYAIALGGSPLGHKRQEGDERTPEGRYLLDWRNSRSGYFRSIHISYPNSKDEQLARTLGVEPGGMIMIHGQPNGYGWWGWMFQMFDWTDGCIAVGNAEMAEIWEMVPDGTPIEINP